VVEDPALARSLGEAGRARVEAEFGVDRMVERFAALYERLAREKGV
jgi:glycosyltransferase involved in cell wall biosynthesis